MPEHLWAPWRMTYIQQPGTKTEGCIFVELPKQDNDRENLILHRGKTAFVMLNRFPYTNGHLMVVPFKHVATLEDLDDNELLEVNQLLVTALGWLRKAYRPQGFNIGVNIGAAAGAGIPDHVHWHIVPRWSGDTNFMTAVGDVRVHPEDLASTYDRLLAIKNEAR